MPMIVMASSVQVAVAVMKGVPILMVVLVVVRLLVLAVLLLVLVLPPGIMIATVT